MASYDTENVQNKIRCLVSKSMTVELRITRGKFGILSDNIIYGLVSKNQIRTRYHKFLIRIIIITTSFI